MTDLDELDRRAEAAEAVLAAKEEGLCRFAGITGHGLDSPAAHRVALERYDFDTVMFPVNPRLWADPQYREDAEALLEEAQRRDVGVMVIKAGAARPWTDEPRHSTTWYEPYTAVDGLAAGHRVRRCRPRAWPRFCTPGDVAVLTDALEIAASCRRWTTRAATGPIRAVGRRAADLPDARLRATRDRTFA